MIPRIHHHHHHHYHHHHRRHHHHHRVTLSHYIPWKTTDYVYIYICVCVLLIFHKSASPNPQAKPCLQRSWPRIGLIPMVPLCLWRSTRPRSVGPGGGWSMSMWYDLGMLVNAWIGSDISIYGWLVVWNMNFIFPNSWDDDPIWRTHIFQGVGIKWGYPQMVGLYKFIYTEKNIYKWMIWGYP